MQNTCAIVSFLIKLQVEACNFIKKETLAQVFSCEFCKISKSTFFIEHLWWLLQYCIGSSGTVAQFHLQYFLSSQRTHNNTLLHLLTRSPTTTNVFFL